jgi:hypothetical protein
MAGKIKYLAIPAFLFQIVFICPALAHHETAKLLASDANAGDSFGISIAIDGNIAVVGAYLNDSNGPNCGAAYVYELSGSQWLQRQKLTPSDGSPGDNFGRSVAIEGNTIVVGSYIGDANELNTGSAYVFTRSGTVWSQQQKLAAPDANTGDKFGCSVSIDNNTIVIGAYGDGSNTGSAYVFTLAGSIWDFQQKLSASDACSGDLFGYSVAIDANTVIIGAPQSNYLELENSGSAYVFTRSSGLWSQQTVLYASDAGYTNYFGWSVALDGNFAVIGAYECDINGVLDAGAVYIFSKTDSDDWVQQQKLFDAYEPNIGEDFGWSVAVKNDTILVGCPAKSFSGKQTGSVFEFVLKDSTWVLNDRLTAGDANNDDKFGSSVALSGSHIIVGAPYNYNDGNSSGSAYVFDDVLAADLDGDSDVDFADFAVFAHAWLTSSGLPRYDPDCDISIPPDVLINLLDLDILADSWLVGK